MKKKVELPLIEPMFSTYHHQSAGCVASISNPTIRNWYLNEAINLKCTSRFLDGYTSPEMGIVNSTWEENPHLEKYWSCMRYADGYLHILIRKFLDNGCYVFFYGIDDYYLEGKSWYKSHHTEHDGLICGYDQEARTYTIRAYDVNWVYNVFKISQKSFDRARESIFKTGYYGGICGLKASDKIVKLNPVRIYENLLSYLNSNFINYPLQNREPVYGIIVHDYLAMYIGKLADRSIPYERMDRRVFRLLWEHKKVMHERLQAVEHRYEFETRISNAYEDLIDEANMLRMMYASHRLKKRDSVLPIIQEKLLLLKRKEEYLLSEFVTRLGGLVNNEIMERHLSGCHEESATSNM